MERNNSTLQPQPKLHRESRGSLILHVRDSPSYQPLSIGIIVLVCLTWILIWNWRRHKLSKDAKLGFIQTKCPLFTDTFLLLWGLGSGYGIIFAVKSPFYELLQISATVGIIFKGVVAILVGFTIGFVHVYYESENDYRTVRRSLTEMKRRNYDDEKTKIISCNFKDMFLVFWSLGSGYGILFAIESWIYEIFGLKSMTAYWIKPYVAILFGFGIGCVHFYFDVLQSRIYEWRTYRVISDNKISDNESDLDNDNGSDEHDSDHDLYDEMKRNTDENLAIELTAFSQHSRLERTATIEEFSELKDDGSLLRSNTYVPKKIYWKRSARLNTM
eukprot:386192_1